MDTDTTAPATAPTEPTADQIAKATQEFYDATDRLAIVKKYPFLMKSLPEYNPKPK